MPKVKTTRPKKTQKSGTNSGISKKEGQRSNRNASQQGQNAPAQATGQNQQKGHGDGQAQLGGQSGQHANNLGGSIQSATSAQGQQAQYPGQLKWRIASTPGNQQGAVGQGGSSSTSASGLGTGTGVGAGAHGSTMNVNNFRYYKR